MKLILLSALALFRNAMQRRILIGKTNPTYWRATSSSILTGFDIWAWAFCSLPQSPPIGHRTCWNQSWIPVGPKLWNLWHKGSRNPRTHRESKNPSWIPSGRRKTWCQETLGHLSQGTEWYLASWSCLCSAVLGHPPPAAAPQHSTAQAWPTGQIPFSALAKMT